MIHKQKVFTFLNRKGERINLLSKRFCFNIDELIQNRIGKEDIQDHISEDMPLLLEGSGIEGIDWSQNIEEVSQVYIYFHSIRVECATETIAIRERNPCFELTTTGFSFNYEEYLSEEELKRNGIQALCDDNPQVFDYTLKNYCACEFTAFHARAIANTKHLEAFHEYTYEQIRRNNA